MSDLRPTMRLCVALLLCSLVSLPADAGGESRQDVQVRWDVLDAGGGMMSTTGYLIGGSVGQVSSGISEAGSWRVSGGYWAAVDSLPPPISGDEFIRADANADSTISMSDAIYTLKYLYVPGAPDPTCMKTADSDDNGEVAMSDAIYTLKYLYVPGEPPPPPPCCDYPSDCGPDPTPDDLDCGAHPCFGGK